jgi:hypothetical protein
MSLTSWKAESGRTNGRQPAVLSTQHTSLSSHTSITSNTRKEKEMAKHHPDLVFCRKLPGIALGRLCEKHDGLCVVCDSYVRPHVLVHICDECNYGSFEVSHFYFLKSMERIIISPIYL